MNKSMRMVFFLMVIYHSTSYRGAHLSSGCEPLVCKTPGSGPSQPMRLVQLTELFRSMPAGQHLLPIQ
jgi:hypothetical protein